MRAPARLAALLLGAGCTFPEPSAAYRCEVTAECEAGRVCEQGFCVVSGRTDASPGGADAPDAPTSIDCASWPAPRHFQPCDLPPPAGPLALAAGEHVYDTTAGTLTGPSGATVASKLVAAGRVISIDRLAIAPGAKLRVVGAYPLIVASWGAIEVSGELDASSGPAARGAGANPPACAAHAATPGEDNNAGASGGGGGGYQGAGGRGGRGDAGNPGAGGGAVAAPLLLGGCPGNRGGHGDQANGGAGGAGGGAVQLTARLAIAIAGKVHAGGAGGGGATGPDGGGGGGGSGGMIGLESPSITVAPGAVLAANGGGGGQGSNVAPGGAGQPGAPDTARALGGTGGDGQGAGGLGSGGATLAGAPGTDDNDHGAGGGGGGAGYVVIAGPSRQLDPAAKVSPAVSILP
jgi:hypothetical protein